MRLAVAEGRFAQGDEAAGDGGAAPRRLLALIMTIRSRNCSRTSFPALISSLLQGRSRRRRRACRGRGAGQARGAAGGAERAPGEGRAAGLRPARHRRGGRGRGVPAPEPSRSRRRGARPRRFRELHRRRAADGIDRARSAAVGVARAMAVRHAWRCASRASATVSSRRPRRPGCRLSAPRAENLFRRRRRDGPACGDRRAPYRPRRRRSGTGTGLMRIFVAGETERIDERRYVDLDQSPGEIVLISAADSGARRCCRGGRKGWRPAEPPPRQSGVVLAIPIRSISIWKRRSQRRSVRRRAADRRRRLLALWPRGARALARGGGPRLIVVPGGDERWDPALEAFCRFRKRIAAGLAAAPSPAGRRMSGARSRNFATSPAMARGRTRRRRCRWPGSIARPAWKAAGRWRSSSSIARCSRAARPDRSMRWSRHSGARGSRRGPCFVTSPKNPEAAAFLDRVAAETPPAVVLNCTAFALSKPGAHQPTVLDRPGRPVLQIVSPAWRGPPGRPRRAASARAT